MTKFLSIINRRINLKTKKGFALVQVLLAIALGSMVSIGVVGYYNHTAKTQHIATISDQVVQNADKSKVESGVGLSQNDNFVIDSISMNTANGVATLTSMDKAQCQALQLSLSEKGTVTDSSCLNNNPSLNKIVFTPTSIQLSSANNALLTSGVADAGATDTVIGPDLTGTAMASATTESVGSTSGSFGSSSTSAGSTSSLLNGNPGTVVTGGTVTSPSTGTPPVYTGSATMACSWRLANSPAFATQNLGTRATSCPAGSVSASNQSGTRTFACSNPNAATDPVGTDTWTGGSCATTCATRIGTGTFVTTSLGTRATSCPAGSVSTSNENGTRTWSCGANGGLAVDPVSTDTWTGGSCATSCGTRLGTGSFVTTSLGTRATSCPAGQQSTSNQTGTRTWSCANSALPVNPTNTDTWSGGSCGVTCVPLASQTQNIGCPPSQVGNHWQKRDSSCPSSTGSPVWGSWYDTSVTCAVDTSCTGMPGYAWNGASCQLTCNAQIPSPSTGSQSRAKPAADCAAGTTPSGNETRTFSYSCASTFAVPTQNWTSWSGGSCVAVTCTTYVAGSGGAWTVSPTANGGVGLCGAHWQSKCTDGTTVGGGATNYVGNKYISLPAGAGLATLHCAYGGQPSPKSW